MQNINGVLVDPRSVLEKEIEKAGPVVGPAVRASNVLSISGSGDSVLAKHLRSDTLVQEPPVGTSANDAVAPAAPEGHPEDLISDPS
jgi:hypothetical protein